MRRRLEQATPGNMTETSIDGSTDAILGSHVFFFFKPVPSPNELITVNTKKNPTLEVLPWDADEKLGGILILDSLKKTSKGRHPQPSVSFFLCGRRIV